VSVVAILIMWMNHRGLFRFVRKVSGPLLVTNALLLLTVTFILFPTAVLAGHLQGPSAMIAAAFYCETYLLINIAYNFGHYAPTGSASQSRAGHGKQYLAILLHIL
jgi:uncharacterized membrane protein